MNMAVHHKGQPSTRKTRRPNMSRGPRGGAGPGLCTLTSRALDFPGTLRSDGSGGPRWQRLWMIPRFGQNDPDQHGNRVGDAVVLLFLFFLCFLFFGAVPLTSLGASTTRAARSSCGERSLSARARPAGLATSDGKEDRNT